MWGGVQLRAPLSRPKGRGLIRRLRALPWGDEGGWFTIPNVNDPSSERQRLQAMPDKVDIDILVAGVGGTGVVAGCTVTERSPVTMGVAVAGGSILVNNEAVVVAGANIGLAAAHATLPRFDLIVVNDAGVVSAVAGTPAATSPAPGPVFPALPANSAALASVLVQAAVTTIVTDDITDKRVPVSDVLQALTDFQAALDAETRVRGASDAALQPWDADLTTIAGLASDEVGVIASDGAGWVRKTYLALKTLLATQRDLWMPDAYLAQNFDRRRARDSAAPLTSGRESMTGITLPAGMTISSIAITSGTTAFAAGATSNNKWFTVRDDVGNLLAWTTDDGATAWAASTEKVLAIAKDGAGATITSFTTTYTGRYYIGVMVSAVGAGGVVPTILGMIGNGTLWGKPPVTYGFDGTHLGLTTTPPNPAAALTAGGNDFYAAVA